MRFFPPGKESLRSGNPGYDLRDRTRLEAPTLSIGSGGGQGEGAGPGERQVSAGRGLGKKFDIRKISLDLHSLFASLAASRPNGLS